MEFSAVQLEVENNLVMIGREKNYYIEILLLYKWKSNRKREFEYVNVLTMLTPGTVLSGFSNGALGFFNRKQEAIHLIKIISFHINI